MQPPFSLWFFGPDEDRIGAVESTQVPTVGDLVDVPGDPHVRRVTAVHWIFTHPDTPAARDGRVAIVQILLGAPAAGIFSR